MEYTNSQMRLLIDEHIHNCKHREALCFRYCDGMTYEEISERTHYSPQHIKYLCTHYRNVLISHL